MYCLVVEDHPGVVVRPASTSAKSCCVRQEVWTLDVSETLNLDNLLMKIKINHYFTKNFLVTLGKL